MKKFLSIVSVCFLLVAMMVAIATPVFAATPKEEILAAAKKYFPAEEYEKHLPTMENVLQQIEVTAEQAEVVIANIENVSKIVTEEKGFSVSEYSEKEREALLKELDVACETLEIKYEIKPAANPTHKGDVDCVFIVEDKPIANLDGDIVKKTDVAESTVNYGLILVAAVFAAAAAVVALRGKKATSC
ncbi:MAG: hypothetical protein J6Q42_06445 [Clostridia bacterium]|nr:hypothetical protein [Clostridia bacterium]